jgi:hypothetical protein
LAWLLRRDEPADPSGIVIALEIIAVLGALVTGWLGGELIDRLGVGDDPRGSSGCTKLPFRTSRQESLGQTGLAFRAEEHW